MCSHKPRHQPAIQKPIDLAAPPPTVPAIPADITIEYHSLLQLTIFDQAMSADNPMHILDLIDWLHTGWRIRNQMLQPTRRLDFAGLLMTPTFLNLMQEQLGLTDADLDPSNKQSIDGMLKVRHSPSLPSLTPLAQQGGRASNIAS